ncbi:ATP-binding protein [Brevibacillus massiliensis]|uniref:ATP-binding protein n=1 Tax=Brevibacillus massiliensis TaxID=1118054 RepID=UPI0003024472|nr:ATP-binding protein [Brevibacillus massiliensis]
MPDVFVWRPFTIKQSRILAKQGNRRGGLGLALVKEMIGQQQGQVGVESDGDRHTFRFTISLAGNADAK